MNGVTAFVNGLHLLIFGLTAAFAGIIAMSVSLVLNFSKKRIRLAVPVLALIGTVLLTPAAAHCISYITDLKEMIIGIIGMMLTVLIIFYDIKVIVKYIKQKKNKPTEEQQNG